MIRSSIVVLVCLLAAGCAPATGELGPIDDDPTPDTPGDDDDDLPGDDDDDDDDDDDTTSIEADWHLSGQLTVAADAEVPAGDVRVVLFDTAESSCCEAWQQVVVGPITQGQAVPFQFGMPDVLEEERWFGPAPDAPGLEIAAFSVGAYIDRDGDGRPGPGDTFVAGALHTTMFLRGTLPAEHEAAGMHLGWNEMRVDLTGPTGFTALVGDHTGPDTAANLLAITPPSALTALVRPELSAGPAGPRLVELLALNMLMELPVAAPVLANTEVAEPGLPNQVVTFPDPLPDPADDHYHDALGDAPLVDAEVAAYIVYAYPDANGDGSWTFPSEPLLAAIDGPPPGEQTLLVRTRATGFQARFMAELFGHLGWTILRPEPDEDGAPIVVPWTDGLLLE